MYPGLSIWMTKKKLMLIRMTFIQKKEQIFNHQGSKGKTQKTIKITLRTITEKQMVAITVQ